MARSRFEKARRLLSGIAIVAFIGIAVLNEPPVRSEAISEAIVALAAVLLIVGALGRIWAALYLNGRKSKVLCTGGPFSLTRNPLYLFSLIGALGVAMMTQSMVLSLSAAIAIAAYFQLIIREEEKRLKQAFGEEFAEYERRVPRFLPRLSGYREEETLVVRPSIFLSSIIDASWFLWVFVLVELIESLRALNHGSMIPTLWRLP